MHVVTGRGVNTIYPQVVNLMRKEGRRAESRNGPVLVLNTPFCAVYERPTECVLLDPARRANPYLHLMECLWHMAARTDAAYLDHYVADFGARFANSLGQLDGAYGARWRNHFYDYRNTPFDQGPNLDQLLDVVAKLRKNPDDRRIVIQMWDPEVDNDPATRDACCNQQLFVRIVEGAVDLTVTCRSNDAIWGALGANCTHFPFLQQWLAGMLGRPVGKFYQFSNNYHVYESAFAKIGSPRPALLDPYLRGEVSPAPIMTDPNTWDTDLARFMVWHDELWATKGVAVLSDGYANSWFGDTAERMAVAYWHYRAGDVPTAQRVASDVVASDWRAGALLWLDQAAIRAAQRELRDASGQDVRPG